MNIKLHQSRLRTIRKGDDAFMLRDGFVTAPRAMIHIMPECPSNVRETINWAFSSGYLKPVATVYDHELTWDKLST